MADPLHTLEAGLHELEPTPTHDPAASNEKTPPPSSRTGSLGLSQHSAIWYLTRIQRYSTYAFSAFAVMHITNTSIIPLITRSVPASEPYLLLTRPYYQSPAAEPFMVILPMWSHIISGVAIRVLRRNHNARRYGNGTLKEDKASFFSEFWPQVSGISKLGFQFTPLLIGHMLINRGIPKIYGGGGNIELSYVSHAFARHPALSFAGFAALLGVGCFHITWGWAKWLGWTPDQVTELDEQRPLQKKRRWYIINGIAAAVTGLWMAGSFEVLARGGAAPGYVGRQYDEMYRMIPVVGRWM